MEVVDEKEYWTKDYVEPEIASVANLHQQRRLVSGLTSAAP